MTQRIVTGVVLALVVLACSPAQPSAPSRSKAIGVVVSEAPSVAPMPSPSSLPPAPSVAASANATRPAASPSAASPSAATLSEEERALVEELRQDVRVDCRPRRTDLPELATAGVECVPRSDLVARVGVYGFASGHDAAMAYLARMAKAGVAPNSGDCIAGTAGDGAWTPGDGEETTDRDVIVVDGHNLVNFRNGCFFDENRTANVRLTCWSPTYVGILGRTQDVSALLSWAWEYPDDVEQGTPGPPGICPYEPGLSDSGPLSEGDTP